MRLNHFSNMNCSNNKIITVSSYVRKQKGFTLVELIAVIVILGILSAIALPKLINISSDARVASLESIAGSMRSTIHLVKAKAYAVGMAPYYAGYDQSKYIINTTAGSSELDLRNLCPESKAESGDKLQMSDYMTIGQSGGLSIITDNQYTRVGYDIQGSGPATVNGCYVTYDSFGTPDCTIEIIDTDC